MLQKLNHKHIIKTYGLDYTADGKLCIFMENAKFGSIANFFKDHPESFVKPYDAVSTKSNIIDEVISAVAYMHGLEIMHRDLKTDNILMHGDGHTRLADFGTARNTANTVV